MNKTDSPDEVHSSAQLGLLPEPAAWANSSDLISARLGRERYGAHGACEMHTWREGGPTDYHGAPLYTAEQLRAAVAAERANNELLSEMLAQEKLLRLHEVAAERERCAKLLRHSNASLLLMAGEMTAQELRTVHAVLNGIRAQIERA